MHVYCILCYVCINNIFEQDILKIESTLLLTVKLILRPRYTQNWEHTIVDRKANSGTHIVFYYVTPRVLPLRKHRCWENASSSMASQQSLSSTGAQARCWASTMPKAATSLNSTCHTMNPPPLLRSSLAISRCLARRSKLLLTTAILR